MADQAVERVGRRAEGLAVQVRRDVLTMISRAGAAHVASALSVADVLASAYAVAEQDDGRVADVILSKGHAGAALYATLAGVGILQREELDTYCLDGSRLWGHATTGVPGIVLSTGSLGHGLPFGLGRAIARARRGEPGEAIVVMSDGEMQEGTTWESALIAAHHRVGNLKVIVDRNLLQSLASTEETVGLEPLEDKWRSCGWETSTIDGHDHVRLVAEITRVCERPACIIASTTKGKGVSFMEGRVEWHYRAPTGDQLDQALAELQ